MPSHRTVYVVLIHPSYSLPTAFSHFQKYIPQFNTSTGVGAFLRRGISTPCTVLADFHVDIFWQASDVTREFSIVYSESNPKLEVHFVPSALTNVKGQFSNLTPLKALKRLFPVKTIGKSHPPSTWPFSNRSKAGWKKKKEQGVEHVDGKKKGNRISHTHVANGPTTLTSVEMSTWKLCFVSLKRSRVSKRR